MYIILSVLIIAILVPGGAWASLDLKYGQYRELEIRKLLINMIYCNFVIATCVSLTYYILGWENSYFDLINSKDGFELTEVIDEIGFSVLYAMILTIVWLYVSKHDWISRFLIKIGASNRVSEGDIWKQTLDSIGKQFEYCRLYDSKSVLVYEGRLRSHSFKEDSREILFFNAEVFDNSGNLVSKAPFIYVSCPKDQVRLEFFNKGKVQHA